MSAAQKHEFHFVIDREMKINIQRLDIYKEMGSFSGVVVSILSFLTPLVKKEHKWGKQRESRYLMVTPDPNEIRDHVHVYFPDEIYKNLKLLHQDLNWYSIAQLVRGFLLFFLVCVNIYGDTVFQELEKLFIEWNEEDKKTRLTGYDFLRQLITIIQHFQDQNSIMTIYYKNYSPAWIFQL